MKILFFISKAFFILTCLLLVRQDVVAQTKIQEPAFTLLQILPLITFIIAFLTGILNLYLMNKLGKSKEEILAVVRAEFQTEIHELENRMSIKEGEGREINRERLNALKESLELRLQNILDKVELITRK